MDITHTESGPAIITHRRLALVDEGSVALGLLLDRFSGKPESRKASLAFGSGEGITGPSRMGTRRRLSSLMAGSRRRSAERSSQQSWLVRVAKLT